MTVTAVPSGHFQGGRALTQDPTTGSDVRSLEDIANEIITDLNAASAELATITSPFQYIGDIALAADFPTAAAVQSGWLYAVTAPVTDNDPTKTNTGDSFLTGDKIYWNGTGWSLAERGASTATPQALGVAAAGTSLVKSNEDHVHAHGNQAGGTLHADAVAGAPGTSGFMTGVQAAALAAIADDHVTAHIAGLDIKVDEENQSAALAGDALKTFVPTHLVLKTVVATAPLNADGTINVGTAVDGTQIASGVALTGLTTVGAARVVPLAANTSAVAGNATLHANVESAESGGGTLELDVYVIGRQV